MGSKLALASGTKVTLGQLSPWIPWNPDLGKSEDLHAIRTGTLDERDSFIDAPIEVEPNRLCLHGSDANHGSHCERVWSGL